VFNRRLDLLLERAQVPEATRRALEPERTKLGAMQAPKGTPEEQAQAIHRAVAGSLDRAFRMQCLGCAGLAVLSSAAAAAGVRRKPR